MRGWGWIVSGLVCLGCGEREADPLGQVSGTGGGGGVAPASDGEGSDGGDDESGPAGTSGDDAETTDDDGAADDGAEMKFDVGADDDDGFPTGEIPDCDALAEGEATSVGCEFWATRLPIGSSDSFGIGFGNPYHEEVMIQIEDHRAPGPDLRVIHELVLGPYESALVNVEGEGGLLPDESHAVTIFGLTEDAAFRITSDQPITAMQIAPVGGAPSAVPEASLLLPTRALGTAYYGIGYTRLDAMYSGFMTVVAVEEGTTVSTSDGVMTLGMFDAYTTTSTDVTGHFVSSDRPIAVFAGARGAYVPQGAGWADHLEEQLLPTSAWGTRYVGARHPVRTSNGIPEPVYWRVIAAQSGAEIVVTPGPTVELEPGQSFEFESTGNFIAEADEPFMLVQYMGGGEVHYPNGGCDDGAAASGDPFMMQMVPTDQWLPQLPFITDDSYARDFVTIARTVGTTVKLACFGDIPDDRFDAVAGTDIEVATIMLDLDHTGGEGDCEDGQQYISASAPVGISVGGYDCAASYGYPGGMSVNPLWDPPEVPPAG